MELEGKIASAQKVAHHDIEKAKQAETTRIMTTLEEKHKVKVNRLNELLHQSQLRCNMVVVIPG